MLSASALESKGGIWEIIQGTMKEIIEDDSRGLQFWLRLLVLGFDLLGL